MASRKPRARFSSSDFSIIEVALEDRVAFLEESLLGSSLSFEERPLYEMDLIDAGEAAYAAMKRSTNGGGENSPALEYQEDYYEMFLADLASLKNRKRPDEL